jgi:hypothetical protein
MIRPELIPISALNHRFLYEPDRLRELLQEHYPDIDLDMKLINKDLSEHIFMDFKDIDTKDHPQVIEMIQVRILRHMEVIILGRQNG